MLTHEDVPGRKTYGLEHPDQPVLAWDEVRYQGEAGGARRRRPPRDRAPGGRRSSSVEYELLPVVDDAERAMLPDAPQLHPGGNLLRHVPIRHGDAELREADVVVEGEYEVGMQDQAFLGPESGLAVPDGEGGVDLYIATQWLHVDRDQLAAEPRPRARAGARHARRASAARSARARTSRCRSTRACSRCTPTAR